MVVRLQKNKDVNTFNWKWFIIIPKNIQEYLNGLINKPKMFYLDLSTQSKTFTCSHCHRKSWGENTPNLVGDFILAKGYKYQFYLKTY